MRPFSLSTLAASARMLLKRDREKTEAPSVTSVYKGDAEMRRLQIRVHRRFAIVTVALLAIVGLAAPEASAQSPRHFHPRDLVALGDSFAAGSGNTPYIDEACGRSATAAYSEVLARYRLVNLQAFVACGGATTAQVWGLGPHNEPPQINSITGDTDVVTVQALGNDFFFGALAAFCVQLECAPNETVPGTPVTVQNILDSIAAESPERLRVLNTAIQTQIRSVGSNARVIVVGYANPFPDPNGPVGPLCPYMSAVELGVARDFDNALNEQLKKAAGEFGFTYVDPGGFFRGLDVCGLTPAFFPPGVPSGAGGTLHPNQLGQGLYAAAIAWRLFV